MNGITTIITKGQVTIPEQVRNMLSVQIGDKVAFLEVNKKKKEATLKIISKKVIDELAGSLASPIKETDLKKARDKAGRLLGRKYSMS